MNQGHAIGTMPQLGIADFPQHRFGLNRYQLLDLGPPFTCPDRDDHPDDPAVEKGALIATDDGWVCPHCGYSQAWEWAYMAQRPDVYDRLTAAGSDPRGIETWEALADLFCRRIVTFTRLRRRSPHRAAYDVLVEDMHRLKAELIALRPRQAP